MAFSADVVTTNGTPSAGSGGALTFTLSSYPGQQKSIRIDTTSTAQAPFTLEMSHRTEMQSGKPVRHIRTATFRQVKVNTAGEKVEGSVTLTARIPEDSTVTNGDMQNLIARLANTISADSGNRDRFLRGEV